MNLHLSWVLLLILGHQPGGGLGSGMLSEWILLQLSMRMKPTAQDGRGTRLAAPFTDLFSSSLAGLLSSGGRACPLFDMNPDGSLEKGQRELVQRAGGWETSTLG